MSVTFSWTLASPATPIPGDAPAPGEQAGADAERDWALDPISGDLQLGTDGDAVFLRGVDAIASDLQSEFSMFLGEWYLDLLAGFPWFQEVLGFPLDETKLRRRVDEHARVVPGVVEVTSYELTQDAVARSIAIDFSVKCDNGAVIAATATVTEGA